MPDLGLQAPRLSDPSKRSTDGFYTPYFQTFTFEGMLEAGEADFVLGQYKSAWGWAMRRLTTDSPLRRGFADHTTRRRHTRRRRW